MSNILIVTEIQNGKIREASYELVTAAQKLGGSIKSLVVGQGAESHADEFAKKGGGDVLLAPTWVSTASHDRGTMCFRWVRPEGFATDGAAPRPPNPAAHVVRTADLAAFLRDGANDLFAEPAHVMCTP